MDTEKEFGADRALVASDGAPAGLHPTGFDHGEGKAICAAHCPPGRYLLREDSYWAKPFEAEIVEWTRGGRVRIRLAGGMFVWRENGHSERLPLLVEALDAIAMAPAGPRP